MIGLKIIVICYVLYVFEVKDNLVIVYRIKDISFCN